MKGLIVLLLLTSPAALALGNHPSAVNLAHAFGGAAPAGAPAAAPGAAPAGAPGPAAAVGASPAPAAATRPGLVVSFELGNVNYDDLEKNVPTDDLPGNPFEADPHAPAAPAVPEQGSNVLDGIANGARMVGDEVGGTAEAVSEATKDTAQQYTGQVNEGVKEASADAAGGVAGAAQGTHAAVAATGDTVQGATHDTAHAAHHGVHGEEVLMQMTTASSVMVAEIVENTIRDTFAAMIAAAAAPDGLNNTEVAPLGLTPNGTAPSPAAVSTVFKVQTAFLASAVLAAAPGPAPAAAPAAGPAAPLAVSAPLATGKLADLATPMNIFVEFLPGALRPIDHGAAPNDTDAPPPEEPKHAPGSSILRHVNPLHHQKNYGRVTKVQVVITDTPESNVNRLPVVERVLTEAEASGALDTIMGGKLMDSIGLAPTIENFHFGIATLPEWSVPKCLVHMTDVIKKNSVAYTRRMVPSSLFNECTNFEPAMSFSHDLMPSKIDVHKCRMATIRFAKAWNYGQGEAVAAPPSGLALASKAVRKGQREARKAQVTETALHGFCVDVCHAKFGPIAPECSEQVGPLR